MQKREGVSLRQEIEGSRSRGTVRNFDDRACYGVGLPTDPRARPHYVFLVGLSQPRASPGSLDGPARCRAWGRHGLRTKAKPLVVLPHLAGGFAVSETALGTIGTSAPTKAWPASKRLLLPLARARSFGDGPACPLQTAGLSHANSSFQSKVWLGATRQSRRFPNLDRRLCCMSRRIKNNATYSAAPPKLSTLLCCASLFASSSCSPIRSRLTPKPFSSPIWVTAVSGAAEYSAPVSGPLFCLAAMH